MLLQVELLEEFSKDKDKDIVIGIANLLVECTAPKNEYYIRLAATLALGKFLRTSNPESLIWLSIIDDHFLL
jgi:hypothetical protein